MDLYTKWDELTRDIHPYDGAINRWINSEVTIRNQNRSTIDTIRHIYATTADGSVWWSRRSTNAASDVQRVYQVVWKDSAETSDSCDTHDEDCPLEFSPELSEFLDSLTQKE